MCISYSAFFTINEFGGGGGGGGVVYGGEESGEVADGKISRPSFFLGIVFR